MAGDAIFTLIATSLLVALIASVVAFRAGCRAGFSDGCEVGSEAEAQRWRRAASSDTTLLSAGREYDVWRVSDELIVEDDDSSDSWLLPSDWAPGGDD